MTKGPTIRPITSSATGRTPDGKRLSKRHGATALDEYRRAGFLAEAMANFLALLGWSSGEDRELMPIDDLVRRFGLDRINKKPAIFDHEKLEWLVGRYMSETPAAQLVGFVSAALVRDEVTPHDVIESDRDRLERVVDCLKPRAKTLVELAKRARVSFPGAIEYDAAAVAKHWRDRELTIERLARLRAVLAETNVWDEAGLELQLLDLAELMGIGAGKLIHPLRLALVGEAVSPGIFEVMRTMGRDLVLARVDDALRYLRRDAE